MQKLIEAFKANPSKLTAQKIRAYHQKHPMSALMVAPADLPILTNALEMAMA